MVNIHIFSLSLLLSLPLPLAQRIETAFLQNSPALLGELLTDERRDPRLPARTAGPRRPALPGPGDPRLPSHLLGLPDDRVHDRAAALGPARRRGRHPQGPLVVPERPDGQPLPLPRLLLHRPDAPGSGTSARARPDTACACGSSRSVRRGCEDRRPRPVAPGPARRGRRGGRPRPRRRGPVRHAAGIPLPGLRREEPGLAPQGGRADPADSFASLAAGLEARAARFAGRGASRRARGLLSPLPRRRARPRERRHRPRQRRRLRRSLVRRRPQSLGPDRGPDRPRAGEGRRSRRS
ncbi:MAG: hypothetical protein M0C28_02385 [Candidatus Moduliflexus flocculans]|nr:hypothetical protein [Candidatus Moduliflexus flocculans]